MRAGTAYRAGKAADPSGCHATSCQSDLVQHNTVEALERLNDVHLNPWPVGTSQRLTTRPSQPRKQTSKGTNDQRNIIVMPLSSSSSRAKPAIHLEVTGDLNDEVRDVTDEFVFKTPCLITGLGAGVSSAMLGYLFGFGGYWISQRTSGTLRLANQGGLQSAKAFSVLGGLYAGVSCFMQRLRQKNDAVNAGASGCATGLVLGWGSGGWLGGLQSCVLFGVFSYMLDGTTGGSAEASDAGQGGSREELTRRRRGERGGRALHARRACVTRSALQRVLAPALPLNGDYFR